MKSAGKEVKRQMLVEKVEDVDTLIKEFCEELKPHANHFIADWQRRQYKKITQTVPKDWIVYVADFFENYRCVYNVLKCQFTFTVSFFNYFNWAVLPGFW